ncbi:MAG: hypothetical protein RLZ97_1064 [Verrucomicrobiota bacterium]
MKLIVADTGPVNYLDGVRFIGFPSATASSTLSATPDSSASENSPTSERLLEKEA